MTEPSRDIHARLILSGVIELIGLASIVWGCSLVLPLLGFVTGGLGLFWIARAINPPAEPPLLRQLLLAKVYRSGGDGE